MSKKLLAVAIAAALAPAVVMAEAANVTMYGRIDYGFMSRSGTDGAGSRGGRTDRLNDFEDGIAGSNRIGFRGSEALGNGLKAIFEFEFGFNGDTDGTASSNFNRHSWIGLEGAFGTVLGGRVDGARYSFVGQYDPFKNQTVANAGSIFGYTSGLGQADRANNAIVYITPEVAPGLKFLGAYTTSLLTEGGTTSGITQDVNTGDTPLYAVAAMYNNGPISVTLDYENLQFKKSAVGGNDLEFNIYVAGASYDFGMVKVSGYYENVKGDNNASRDISDSDGWLLGVTVPVTANITLKASYVTGESDVDARGAALGTKPGKGECEKWGVGGEYSFSKRTMLYATYAQITADSQMTCGLTKSAAGAGAGATAAGSATAYGDKGFNIGIAHTF